MRQVQESIARAFAVMARASACAPLMAASVAIAQVPSQGIIGEEGRSLPGPWEPRPAGTNGIIGEKGRKGSTRAPAVIGEEGVKDRTGPSSIGSAGKLGVIGEKGRASGEPCRKGFSWTGKGCRRTNDVPSGDTEVRIPVLPKTDTVGGPTRTPGPTGPKAVGVPFESLLEGGQRVTPVAFQSPSVKVAKLNEALGMQIEPDGLGRPIRLTPLAPYVAGNAFVNSFSADVNTGMGVYGLNGRQQERLVIGFKPAQANKPVLISVGVAQASTGGRGPTILKIEGPGVSQAAQLSTGPTHVNAVVTPTDTQWYRVTVAVEATHMALIQSIELTPIK